MGILARFHREGAEDTEVSLDAEAIGLERGGTKSQAFARKLGPDMGTYFHTQLSCQWLRKILSRSEKGKSNVLSLKDEQRGP